MKPKKELIIAKKKKKKLNNQQRTFNRLVKELENLRTEKVNSDKFLSENLDYYGKHIHKLEEETADIAAQAAKTFYRLYHEQKALGRIEKEILVKIIETQLSEYFSNSRNEPDKELKEIFEFVEGESFEEVAESDFQFIKTDMQETFEEMGFDIDLEDFTSDLSEEELIRKMFEKLGGVKEQLEAEEESEKKRKKTKKQIAKEEREKKVEEAKNKNISAIYKQLAKIFHPDLERNEKSRAKKEVLMKQLTAAYKQGDLHMLLKLELEWLEKEEDKLEKLSNEKLKIYNQALKEQVEELELQIDLIAQHPRYIPLQKYFGMFGINSINLEEEKKRMETLNKLSKQDLKKLNGKKPLKKLREIIRQAKKELKMQERFAFNIEDIFADF